MSHRSEAMARGMAPNTQFDRTDDSASGLGRDPSDVTGVANPDGQRNAEEQERETWARVNAPQKPKREVTEVQNPAEGQQEARKPLIDGGDMTGEEDPTTLQQSKNEFAAQSGGTDMTAAGGGDENSKRARRDAR